MKIIHKYKFHFLFFIMLLGVIFMTYKDYGITWDEIYFLNMGKYFLIVLLRLLNIRTNLAVEGLPSGFYFDLHLMAHGIVFDTAAVFFSLFLKRFSFEAYHLIKALMAVPIFLCTGLIVLKITKNKYISLFAMVLLLLSPRFYGDMFNNPIDIPVALCFALTMCYFVYLIQKKPTLINLLVFSLISAIAISQRLVLAYLVGLNMLIYLIVRLRAKNLLIKTIGEIVFIGLITVLCMHLTNPYLFKHPIGGIFDMVKSIKSYPWTATVLFDGQLIEVNKLPGYYLTKSMLITTPLAIVFLFFIGNIYLLYLFFKERKNIINGAPHPAKRDGVSLQSRGERNPSEVKLSLTKGDKTFYIYFLLIFYIPVLLFYFLRPVIYEGWRHFMFLTIPMIIIASFGLLGITRIKYKLLTIIVFVIIGLNLAQTAKEMIMLHPYQYIYYNELVGGLKGAYLHYETDYWGASYKEAVEWFNNNINKKDKKYVVKIGGGDLVSSTYYFKKNMKLTPVIAEADYYISFTRWYLHNYYQGKIIHTVEREGVPLIFIKKMR